MHDNFEQFVACYEEAGGAQVYQGKVYRLVETQEFAATTTLVDDLDEQFLLEQMLEDTKPPYRQGSEHLHYLLKTPFRYPPLKYGSRFGSRLMSSFFYAGEQPETTLAEVAYYRFVFLADMAKPYEGAIQSEHLMFSVKVRSSRCADLTVAGFDTFSTHLRQTSSYQFCQMVGRWLVEEQTVNMLRYHSARCQPGTNVALYDPATLLSKTPENQQAWLCHTKADKVSFIRHGGDSPVSFAREVFLQEGHLPRPA